MSKMNDDKEAMRFDPKAAVANSGVPRKAVSWARAFIEPILKARLARAVSAAVSATTRIEPPTAQERRWLAHERHMRARYGRGWLRRRSHSCATPHQGEREIARRRQQILDGKLSPVFTEHPVVAKEAA